jgi:hypothetical protein
MLRIVKKAQNDFIIVLRERLKAEGRISDSEQCVKDCIKKKLLNKVFNTMFRRKFTSRKGGFLAKK